MPLAETYSLVFQPKFVVHDDTFHRAVYSQGLAPVSAFTTGGGSALIPVITDDGMYPYQPPVPILQRQYRSSKRLWWEETVPLSVPPLDDYRPKTVFSVQSVAISGFATAGAALPIPIGVDDPGLPPRGTAAISQCAHTARITLEWQRQVGPQGSVWLSVLDDPLRRVIVTTSMIAVSGFTTSGTGGLTILPVPLDDGMQASTIRAPYRPPQWVGDTAAFTPVPLVSDPALPKTAFSTSMIAVSGYGTNAAGIPFGLLEDSYRKAGFVTEQIALSGYAGIGASGLVAPPILADDSGIRFTTTFRIPYRMVRRTDETFFPPAPLFFVADDAGPLRVPLVRPSLPRHPYLFGEIATIVGRSIPDDPYKRAVFVSTTLVLSGYASGTGGPTTLGLVTDDALPSVRTVKLVTRVRRWLDEVGILLPLPPGPRVDDYVRRVTFARARPLTIQQWVPLEGLPGALVPPDDPFTFMLSGVVAQSMPWEGAAESMAFLLIAPNLLESPYQKFVFTSVVAPISGIASIGASVAVRGALDDPVQQWMTQRSYRPARWRDETIIVAPVVPLVPAESPFWMPTPSWQPPKKRLWVPDDVTFIPLVLPSLIGELCIEVADSAAHIELFTSAAQCELGTSAASVELQTNLCRAGHRPQF